MGFAVACVSLIISMLIYVLGRKTFKHADVNVKQEAENNGESSVHVQELTPAETKSRVVALCLSVCCCNFLLDGIPSEWSYTYVLCA